MGSDLAPVTPRPAASLIILRGPRDAPEVLMGRRRDTARFMPGYYVYPGGAVDPCDIALGATEWPGTALHAAALRETWEETGVAVAMPGALPADIRDSDPSYASFGEQGLLPAPEDVHFIARAITPAESPIRFDTRFFLTGDAMLHGEAHAVGELPEVLWVRVVEALSSPKLSGVTKFALGEALSLWTERERLLSPDRPVRVYTYRDNSRVIYRETQDEALKLGD
jgi:8-oxo-dGTP pyrophosphatase MutT (NUDIX family)